MAYASIFTVFLEAFEPYISLIYYIYFLCKLFLHHVYITTVFVYCFILEWGSHVKLAFWFLNCKTCVFMYEATSEMIETYLEYRLRDDDSHTVTLWHNPQIPHCQCFRMVCADLQTTLRVVCEVVAVQQVLCPVKWLVRMTDVLGQWILGTPMCVFDICCVACLTLSRNTDIFFASVPWHEKMPQ